MKAVIKGNDFKGARFIELPPFTCQLNRTLIRFSAAVSKKDFIEATILCEQIR